jgi:hypothetical protein
MEAFGYKDIESLFNVKRTRLAQWQQRGWISAPSIQKAGTPGKANLYSRQDLYRIGLFGYLVTHEKIQCERAAEIIAGVNFQKDVVKRIAGVPFEGRVYRTIRRGDESEGLNLEREISLLELNIKGLTELIDLWIERLRESKE